ncbi:MAG: asparagine synthase (glutamine-hydrolyzing) [Pseudomonadota bacterium]
MCGIFGAFSHSGQPLDDATAHAMAQALDHRGPDAQGWASHSGVTVGNTRLSLIDLSAASNQPLVDEDGAVALVQNGEIYNYIELRETLMALGHRFHTTGDTEVLLRAYLEWGEGFVTRLNGMFAIALHDRRSGALLLARDRLGVKPLYLAQVGARVFFASEIKALLSAGVVARANLTALSQYLALNYVPSPLTAFEGVHHLPPATCLRLDASGETRSTYWRLSDVQPEPDMDASQAQATLRDLLDEATRVRLRADAPFGAFLSGGLDSTSVVASMRDHMAGAVRTYSIGFDDPRFDETPHAKAAAARFKTEHKVQIAEPDTTRLWPHFIHACDQPHGDVSFMPMGMVSALAARDVKMVLTGDGGDELFAGYTKYLTAHESDALSGPNWPERFARDTGLFGPDAQFMGDLADAFAADPHAPLSRAIASVPHQDPINQMLYGDTTVLLPGNNLVKPDRMAMAHSLEVRAPFLDYRMAEFAFQMPGALKLEGGETKAIYKAAMREIVGDTLTYRAKQMFTVPIGEWFRQALAGYCREVLLSGRFAARGLVDGAWLERLVEDHIGGRANHTRQVRALISLELWFRLFIDQDPATLAEARP